jgi:hypothetical protein
MEPQLLHHDWGHDLAENNATSAAILEADPE